MSLHYIVLALVALALVFPSSRRFLFDWVRIVVSPIIAVLFLIAMRLR